MSLRTTYLGYISSTKPVRVLKQDHVYCYFPCCLDTKSGQSHLRKGGLVGLTIQKKVLHGEEGRCGSRGMTLLGALKEMCAQLTFSLPVQDPSLWG